jgi:hypothetical protein
LETSEVEHLFKFERLLDGLENPEYVELRQQQFQQSWGQTERRIQDIVGHANDEILADVTSFVQGTEIPEYGSL